MRRPSARATSRYAPEASRKAAGGALAGSGFESDPRLRSEYHSLFEPLELLFSSLFSLEYLLRLLCSKRPWPYARSFFGLVDLVSSLPPLLTLGIPAGQSLLIVRVLRLLRARARASSSYFSCLGKASACSKAAFAASRRPSARPWPARSPRERRRTTLRHSVCRA